MKEFFEHMESQKPETMCGIAGVYEGGLEATGFYGGNGGGGGRNIEKADISKETEQMLEAVSHRGPDLQTIIQSVDGKFAVGQTRLAIVDVGTQKYEKAMNYIEGNHQCMLTFNGEIYNYKELRKELEQKGYSFETQSDTEVLLKSLAEYGKDVLERLDGQFAFVFRDSDKDEILFVRDRTGKKPLYYSFDGEVLRFASEPTALALEVGFKPDINAVTSLFLSGATFAAGEEPIGESTYENILQLKPGEVMTLNEKENVLLHEIYAKLPLHDIAEYKKEQEYIQDLRMSLEIAIRKRVPLEVETGVALSGGLDSSVVALIAADELTKHNKKLTAACIAYSAQEKNSDYENAEKVAEFAKNKGYNLELLKTELTPENFLDHLEEMVKVLGIQDSIRQLGMYENYRNLKAHGVKVALIGEGADEFNWGYWHKFPGLAQDQEACSTAEGFRSLVLSRKGYVEKLFAKDVREKIDFKKGTDYLVDIYDGFDTTDSTRKMMGIYATVFLGFLNKANDRLSMANAIEARAPFQDNDVVEKCLNTPREAQVKPGIEKHILREAFKNILPEDIYKRPKEPLPAAANIVYHEKILDEFKKRLESIDESFWQYFDKETWNNISKSFEVRIGDLKKEYSNPEEAGEQLMLWRKVDLEIDIIGHEEEMKYVAGKDIRTNDVFKLLTTLVWYQQNLRYKK